MEQPDTPPLTEIPRKTEEELREFVRDVLANRVFTSWGLSADEVRMSFLLIGLGFLGTCFTREAVEHIGIIYEYLHQASPMACNGLPMFFSMRVMHKDDWGVALATLRREQERNERLPLEPPEVTKTTA